MDKEMKDMFDAILEEMARMEERTNKRFDKIDNSLESMQHDVNACKMERESVSILIKKIAQLKKRIEELEKGLPDSIT